MTPQSSDTVTRVSSLPHLGVSVEQSLAEGGLAGSLGSDHVALVGRAGRLLLLQVQTLLTGHWREHRGGI